MPVTTKQTCLACGHNLPISTQYALWNGKISPICIHCEPLSVQQIALNVRDQINLQVRIKQTTRAGRRQARIERRLESYTEHGKRCSSCWHYHPIDRFAQLATSPDGLQYVCRACTALRTNLLAHPGGQSAWLAYRDAIRAKAPPKVTNHGIL